MNKRCNILSLAFSLTAFIPGLSAAAFYWKNTGPNIEPINDISDPVLVEPYAPVYQEPVVPDAETTPNPPVRVDIDSKTATSISITWLDNSAVEDYYTIERREANGVWTVIAQADAVTNHVGHYTDSGGGAIWNSLTPDTEYCYRVVPHNEYGAPADADVPEVCATTDTDIRDLVAITVMVRAHGRVPDIYLSR